MLQIKVVVFAVLVWTLHFPFIDPLKRTKCKIQELKNTSLDFGECLVNTENCDVYWCCDETDRYGELLKYKCIHTVLRLYPLLTRECRKQKCLPEFTWDDSYLTESPYERTMSKNPIIEKITEGIPPDDEEETTTQTTTTTEAAVAETAVNETSVTTETAVS